MYELENPKKGNFVKLIVDGTVRGEDYDRVVPRLERYFNQHGKLNMLVILESIEGMEPEAVWKDLKFTARHYDDIMRFAVVGDSKMDEWIARLSKPFISGEVRFFDEGDEQEAERWVRAGTQPSAQPSL